MAQESHSISSSIYHLPAPPTPPIQIILPEIVYENMATERVPVSPWVRHRALITKFLSSINSTKSKKWAKILIWFLIFLLAFRALFFVHNESYSTISAKNGLNQFSESETYPAQSKKSANFIDRAHYDSILLQLLNSGLFLPLLSETNITNGKRCDDDRCWSQEKSSLVQTSTTITSIHNNTTSNGSESSTTKQRVPRRPVRRRFRAPSGADGLIDNSEWVRVGALEEKDEEQSDE